MKLKVKKEQQKGYIALTTVLVVLPLLLLTGINLVYENITEMVAGKMRFDYNILELNAETCLEESVRKIKFNPQYTGTLNFSLTGWSCEVNVQNVPTKTGFKELNIVANDELNNVVIINKELNTNTDPFEISNI